MERKKITMDGNHAAAHVSYAYTEVAPIYPITPSSVMAEITDEWAVNGRKNIFGNVVEVKEMQSEAGVAGAMHGSLLAGALSTTYTASQGLLLMIPNLYKMAGEQLPGVIQVSARAVASHALSIFGDHSDIYACRQTGVAMLCESSVQEVMDLTPVAHLAAMQGKIPFLNFFDGFRTSHEIQKVETWDYEDLRQLADFHVIEEFRKNALNPNHPCEMGSAQNPDLFFQTRESANTLYQRLPEIVSDQMERINARIGTDYRLFNYYGSREATSVMVAMGSVCETIEEVVDYLKEEGTDTGLIRVHLYRPFQKEAFLQELPEFVEKIIVLDRTKEPGAPGEPLYLDVMAALKESRFEKCRVLHGRYGLGSKNTTPGQILSAFLNEEKEEFTLGITDDVTNLSLEVEKEPITTKEGTKSCKFFGLGADGTVGANKNSIKIIGDYTDLEVQAYFEYDSKKSGGLTISHLRFGKEPIRAAYLVSNADFVACHCTAYLYQYPMVEDLVENGTFLLNCPWRKEELEEKLPEHVKYVLAKNNIHFYIIDAGKLGREIGLGNRVNTILQAAFFALTDLLPKEKVRGYLKDAATKTYAKTGEEVVAMNLRAIDVGMEAYEEVCVPKEWNDCSATIPDRRCHESSKTDSGKKQSEVLKFVEDIQNPVNALKGNEIPVSVVAAYGNGKAPSGTAAYEKRGIASEIPVWIKERCIQCNQCSFVCPHAVIRPSVMTAEEVITAGFPIEYIEMKGLPAYKFAITVSALDCTGCGNCVEVCPAPGKAILMKDFSAHVNQQKQFDYACSLPEKRAVFEKFSEKTVKGSQFKRPLLEFSGACAGCGETPYAKLITQLFGESMYIANATGCSSIWGNSSPSTPYTVNNCGNGPAWANSLFEDAAEFGIGMLFAQNHIRGQLKELVEERLAKETFSKEKVLDEKIKKTLQKWLSSYEKRKENQKATDALLAAIAELEEKDRQDGFKKIMDNKDFLSKKSQWIFGGDGWAYDIGFGGLDHVLASKEDINVLVFDTEVYSNTGGQASKATPLGASARFCAGGKLTTKKNLAMMAMSYGFVYVAQIAMGADKNQCIKAITEAEAYPGPSLLIAYAPCINHGIKKGMRLSQEEEKRAVECGYWINFRYHPKWAENERASFSVDSKALDASYLEFLEGENRYAALLKSKGERAKTLFEEAKKDAYMRYVDLKKIEKMFAENGNSSEKQIFTKKKVNDKMKGSVN